jgi:hypothetical protein
MTTTSPRLNDAQLGEFLALIEDADSVELKLTIPETEQPTAVASLGVDPLDAQIRQVYFFDTPDLALYSSGVVVRGRRVQGKGDDTVVKLRPVVPATMPKKLRKLPEFVIEVDAMPGGFVCSARLKRVVGNADVRGVAHGEQPLRGLLSKPQRRLVREHAAAGGALDELAVLGPILVLKLKFEPAGLDRPLVAEFWMYPDGSRVLELSTKCRPRDAFTVAAETRAFLAERGVDLSGEQEAKTAKALQFFSKRLASAH